jgi:hypothetical protein
MKKLITPFGSISIYINDIEMEYQAIKLENNPVLFPNIDGRYKIVVSYDSDNSENLIYCKIDDMDYSKTQGGHESGERLECQAFYENNMKLSIGIEYDIGYYSTKEGIGNYDYESVYLKNGIGFRVFPSTKSQELTFGLAWINECTDDNDLQT